MPYEKITLDIPLIGSTLAAVAPESTNQAAMLAAAAVVRLDTDDIVWVSSVAADNPETTGIEFATVAIAVNEDGSIRTRSGGVPIATAFMHAVAPEMVVSLGRDVIRKQLILVALAEPLDLPDDFAAMNTAERSIRTAIAAAAQIAAPQTDVL